MQTKYLQICTYKYIIIYYIMYSRMGTKMFVMLEFTSNFYHEVDNNKFK